MSRFRVGDILFSSALGVVLLVHTVGESRYFHQRWVQHAERVYARAMFFRAAGARAKIMRAAFATTHAKWRASTSMQRGGRSTGFHRERRETRFCLVSR